MTGLELIFDQLSKDDKIKKESVESLRQFVVDQDYDTDGI